MAVVIATTNTWRSLLLSVTTLAAFHVYTQFIVT